MYFTASRVEKKVLLDFLALERELWISPPAYAGGGVMNNEVGSCLSKMYF